MQSGGIREPSEVRTQGSISSHLVEEEREGGRQEKRRRRRRGDSFLFLEGCFVFISFDRVCLPFYLPVSCSCLHSVCVCVYTSVLCGFMCVCVSVRVVMLFTQVAVPAQQSLSTAVNLWLIYPSLPLFLVDYNYSLCTPVFQRKKHQTYSMCSHPNALMLLFAALKLAE